jgi:uncharacterized LabA/DUF88 family protein
MRTFIYVDGFNLYYRMLDKRPHLKWLNPKSLAEKLLRPENRIEQVRYYTARVSGRTNPEGPGRQQLYFDALATIPEISIHMGTFISSTKYAGLFHPPKFRPELGTRMDEPWPDVVKVHKTEEKGSDVNLACHILLDAIRDRFDVAAVISNDSDLVEPIRIATQEFGKIVGLLSPVSNANPELKKVSSFIRHISTGHLASAQFPIQIETSSKTICCPSDWAQRSPHKP